MTRLIAIIALIFPAIAGAQAGWVPVDCADRPADVAQLRGSFGNGDAEAAWASYARRVRAAKVGDGKYVPHPFPKTRAQVLTDFQYAYFERLFSDPDDVPIEERRIYQGLRESRLALQVVQVENWGTNRCVLQRPVPFYHVVTILSREGVPLSRAALHYTGILASYSHLSQSFPTGLLPLDDVGRTIKDRYGFDLHVADAQYVTLGGMPNHCGPLSPCVAFRSKRGTYILGRSGESLYTLPARGARRSVSERSEEVRARGLAFGEKDDHRPWLTTGFEWAQAERIAGQDNP